MLVDACLRALPHVYPACAAFDGFRVCGLFPHRGYFLCLYFVLLVFTVINKSLHLDPNPCLPPPAS